MLHLYDYLESGNGYKVRLLLNQLGIPFTRTELDILQGETRTPAYLEKNPNGRIPLLELEDGTCLAESNAIQWYLAEGTRFLPKDKLGRALALQWMGFEQYSHEPNIAVLRFWNHAGTLAEHSAAEIEAKRRGGEAALEVMNQHLETSPFFVRDQYTIADIALYAYTHVAEEGGFDLDAYPHVTAWLTRVRVESDHIPITAEVGASRET